MADLLKSSELVMVKNILNCPLLLYLFLLGTLFSGFAAKANEPPVAVVIYDGANYTGDSIEIRHNTSSLGDMNNKMTSFKVTPGFIVRFFDGENYTGGFYSKKSNAREAKNVPYNNIIESVEILVDARPEAEKPPVAVTVYDGENYTGSAYQFRYDTPSFGSMNKKMTSFKISPGFTVSFFEGENYTEGYYGRNSESTDAAKISFDNKISSMRIIDAPLDNTIRIPDVAVGASSDFEGQSYYEVLLDQTTPDKIATTAVTPSNIEQVEKFIYVYLDLNMDITDGVFTNRTSMVVKDFFVEQNGELAFIALTESIPAYSSAYLGSEWQDATLVKMTRLGNNKMEFGELYEPNARSRTNSAPLIDVDDLSDEEAATLVIEPEKPPPVLARSNPDDAFRRFNAVERASAERIQRNLRFWINSPNGFRHIVEHVVKNCATAKDFITCRQHPDPKRYATDRFYGQSVSGINTRLWIKSSVWGMGTGAGLEQVHHRRSKAVNIWMHPNLMARAESSNLALAVDAEQALAHEYFHNLGFNHASGWPSNQGVDDLFGKVSVHTLRESIGNRYIVSNLAFNTEMINDSTFEFEVFSHDDIENLVLRLLSTQELKVNISQLDTNKFVVQFNEAPQTDVYVSLYSENSQQMASTALDTK